MRAPAPARVRDRLFLVGAVLLAFVPYRGFLGARVPVGRDLLFYFYPLKAHLAEAVRSGAVPWIDRYRWGGTPLLGAPGAAPFDPGNVLFLILPLGAAMKAWILLRIAVGVAGFAFFARRWGLSGPGSAVAGLAFGLSGVAVSLAAFPPSLSAFSVLPWFAFFVVKARLHPSASSLIGLSITTALILLASIPEFAFFAGLLALGLLWGSPGGTEGTDASRLPSRRTLAVLASAALLGGALAAPALLPAFEVAASSTRAPGGGMGLAAAAVGPLAPVRLKEILADGLVADWTKTGRAEGVPDYPYLPSITPGRVALLLACVGLLAPGPGRFRAAGLFVLGALLALGSATPVWGISARLLPFIGLIRYPEKHFVLAGFGLAWLAALGLRTFEARLLVRRREWILGLLALAVLVDREPIARGLCPTEAGEVLTAPPRLLAEVPPALPGEALRLFHRDSLQPVPAFDTRDIRLAARTARESLMPEFGSLFGVVYEFEPDYDLSLPVSAFEWLRLLQRSLPSPSPLPLRFLRNAGVQGVIASEPDPSGRLAARLEFFGRPLPPWRFASRIVADPDGPRLFRRFLSEGDDPATAYIAGPAGEERTAPGTVLAARDGPDALRLNMDVKGPGEGFLMVYRLREATAEALLDGKPVGVIDSGFGFSGLRIPPGRHELRLRPRTLWVKIGLLSALVSAAALLFVGKRDPIRPGPASAG